jgi:hypothetical protein
MNAVKRFGPAAMTAVLAWGLMAPMPAFADKGGNRKPPPLAGWEVTILQPPIEDYDESAALGVSGGQQAGYAINNDGYDHAGLWTGTAAGWVNLHPADALDSIAYGAADGQQVGAAWVFDPLRGKSFAHAGLWSGTAQSWVDLHPYGFGPGWGGSCAYGICGNQVVGAIWGGGEHAILWTVEPDSWSWVDLHPPKASISVAYDVSDGQQVGFVDFAIVKQGSLQGYLRHASLWNGTAESWIDLNPKGYNESEARGISHGYQAGSVQISSFFDMWHAGIWSGTPGSWVDLNALLPTEYWDSEAQDIEVTDTDIWVVGQAHNTMWQSRAVLWHKSLAQ